MKVWGSRSTKFLVDFRQICLIVSLISCTTNIYSNYQDNILAYAINYFDKNTPGLVPLFLQTDQNKGHFFELETALLLANQNENVIGFGLSLTFRNPNECVQINGYKALLQTTEFDIITDNFATECKSGKIQVKKTLDQLIKEQTIIAWCRELVKEIAMNVQNKEKIFGFTHSTRKNQPFVIITTPSTIRNGIPHALHVTSSWFDTKDPDRCINQFISIVQLLATKKVRLCLKNEASPELISGLHRHNIPFNDNVNLESLLPHEKNAEE